MLLCTFHHFFSINTPFNNKYIYTQIKYFLTPFYITSNLEECFLVVFHFKSQHGECRNIKIRWDFFEHHREKYKNVSLRSKIDINKIYNNKIIIKRRNHKYVCEKIKDKNTDKHKIIDKRYLLTIFFFYLHFFKSVKLKEKRYKDMHMMQV